MAIVVNLNQVLGKRKIKKGEFAERIGLSTVNVSRLCQNRVVAVRFSTLEGICRELDCQPGDILAYVPPSKP